MHPALLSQLNTARLERVAVAVLTDLSTGEKRLVHANDVDDDPLAAELETRFRSGKSGIISVDTGELFIQIHAPSPRLVVIGAVHISQALFPIAQACNFDVTVIDPRTAFATKERFSNVTLEAEWPEEALKETILDAYTAVVALTHDPKIDDIPIRAALDAECFYVGALGSNKTHGKRLDRLRAAGVTDDVLERIHAPIGLDIGAASPAEIAVAVMAQIIGVSRRGKSA